MGTNYHTAYSNVAPKTAFTKAAMGAPFADLDSAITKLKNIMVSCAGIVSYNKATGILTWDAAITIRFNSTAGLGIYNTIAAGSLTLTDGKMAYVDLRETNAAALTMTAATVASNAASNFITFNRLVLAYRETTSDNLYPVYLHPHLNVLSVSGTTGGLLRTIAEATGTPAGTTTYFDIAVNVPSGARLLGCQLRVDTALTAGETWKADYATGSTTAIVGTGQAVTKNTKINKMHVDEITTDVTVIRITRDSGNFTNAAGVIRAIVYYEYFATMIDAA